MNETGKLLIVDDDASVRETYEALLARESHTLFFAENGNQALAAAGIERPDVILLDVMMPEMDGFEVCRRLKDTETVKTIPVIMVTALDGKEDLLRGLSAGADEFLTKPVSGTELRARIRTMLRIKRQYDELVETLRLREKLTDMIVKEMRSPVTAALVYSELLKLKIHEPEDLARIQNVWTQMNRLNGYLSDMLLLTKMKAGKALLHRRVIDIYRLVSDLVHTHRSVAALRQIVVETRLPQTPLLLTIDENLTMHALQVLLENALKHAPKESTVGVDVERSEGRPGVLRPLTRIHIIDEGPGYHPNAQSFFYNPHAGAGDTGPGTGLSFCCMVANAHGGRLYYRPNTPKGSVFTLEL